MDIPAIVPIGSHIAMPRPKTWDDFQYGVYCKVIGYQVTGSVLKCVVELLGRRLTEELYDELIDIGYKDENYIDKELDAAMSYLVRLPSAIPTDSQTP